MMAYKSEGFTTREQVERYLGGDSIECLICGERLQRLASHLHYRHGMTADEYRERFGLPWSRGLCSARSRRNGWEDDERRDKWRERASETKFYKNAHPHRRRKEPEFVLADKTKNFIKKRKRRRDV